MTRQECAAIASEAAKRLASSSGFPQGARVVVVVTGKLGEWVGIGSNTHSEDVEAILESALRGAGRCDYRVVEVEP